MAVQLGRVQPRSRGADAVVGLSDVELDPGTGDHVVPPGDELGVVGHREPEVPVHLRHDVVDPLLLDPAAGVGRDRVVGLESVGVRPERIGGLVAPDAERADAELHPRLDGLDPYAHLLDQAVDVVAPPVGLGGETGAEPGVRGVVGEVLTGRRVRVEVVVEVHAVHVVAADDVEDHLEAVGAGIGLARVEPELVAVRGLGPAEYV